MSPTHSLKLACVPVCVGSVCVCVCVSVSIFYWRGLIAPAMCQRCVNVCVVGFKDASELKAGDRFSDGTKSRRIFTVITIVLLPLC